LGKIKITGEKIVVKKEALKKQKSEPTNRQTQEESFSLVEFANETKQELGKVVWPSRQQLISESVAVMLMVTLVATVVYLVDNLFGWASGKVF
jgi:preprotein translocase subunit SecE